MAEKTGKRPSRLDGPPCPDELAYVWEWYCSARPIGSLADIKAWSELYGHRLMPFEVTLLRRLAAVEDRVASQ